jgi:hypothetical protein
MFDVPEAQLAVINPGRTRFVAVGIVYSVAAPLSYGRTIALILVLGIEIVGDDTG